MMIGYRQSIQELDSTGTTIQFPVPFGAKTVSWRLQFIGPDNPEQCLLAIQRGRYSGNLAVNYGTDEAYYVFDMPFALNTTAANRNDQGGECDIQNASYLSWSIAAQVGRQCFFALDLWFYDTGDCNFLGERCDIIAQAGGGAFTSVRYKVPQAAGSVGWMNVITGAGNALANDLRAGMQIDTAAMAVNVVSAAIFSVLVPSSLTVGRNSIYHATDFINYSYQANAVTANQFFNRLRWFKN